MTGYYEDVTNDPGNLQILGTVEFSSIVLPSAAVAASDFGVGLWNTGGIVGFDGIRLTRTDAEGRFQFTDLNQHEAPARFYRARRRIQSDP